MADNELPGSGSYYRRRLAWLYPAPAKPTATEPPLDPVVPMAERLPWLYSGERKGTGSWLHPSEFASEGTGTADPHGLPDQAGIRPQPQQLINPPARFPGRAARPVGPMKGNAPPAGAAPVQQPMPEPPQPGGLREWLESHPHGEDKALLLHLFGSKEPWGGMHPEDLTAVREGLSTAPPQQLLRVLHGLTGSGVHDPARHKIIHELLSHHDDGPEIPLTDRNLSQAWSFPDDGSMLDSERKQFEDSLRKLPRVKGVPGAFLMPAGLDPKKVFGPKAGAQRLGPEAIEEAASASPSLWFGRPLPSPEEARSPDAAWRPLGKESYNADHGGGLWTVRYPDGRRYIAKKHIDPGEADVEAATSGALRMLGVGNVPRMDVRPTKYGRTLFQTQAPGRELFGASDYDLSVVKKKNPPEKLASMLAGMWLLNADDRHGGNYLFTDEGHLYPIDLGFSLAPRKATRQAWGSNADALVDYGLVNREQQVPPNVLAKMVRMRKPVTEHVMKSVNGLEEDYIQAVQQSLDRRFDWLEQAVQQGHPVRLVDLPRLGSPRKQYQRVGGVQRYNEPSPLARGVGRALKATVEGHNSSDPAHWHMASDLLAEIGHPRAPDIQKRFANVAATLPSRPPHDASHGTASPEMTRALHEMLHIAEKEYGKPGFASHVRPVVEAHDAALEHLRNGNHVAAGQAISKLADAYHKAGITEPDYWRRELQRLADAVTRGEIPPSGVLQDSFSYHRGVWPHPPYWHGHRAFGFIPTDTSENGQNILDAQKLLRETGPHSFAKAGQPQRHNLVHFEGPAIGVQHNPHNFNAVRVHPNNPGGVVAHPMGDADMLKHSVHAAAHAVLSGKHHAVIGHSAPEHWTRGEGDAEEMAHGGVFVADPKGRVAAYHTQIEHGLPGWSRFQTMNSPEVPLALEAFFPDIAERGRTISQARAAAKQSVNWAHQNERLHAHVHIHPHPEFRGILHNAIANPSQESTGALYDWLADEAGRPELAERLVAGGVGDARRFHVGPDVAGALAERIDAAPQRHAREPHPVVEKVASAAQDVHPDPSLPQREAGNHKMGHVRLHGLDITIETAKGQTRTKTGADGKPWSRKMLAHYGRIRRTEAADGDHLDVYIGDHPQSELVVVVEQLKESGKHDEFKCVLGCTSQKEAVDLYRSHYPAGWNRVGQVRLMTMPEFKEWAVSDKAARPFRNAMEGTPQRYSLGETKNAMHLLIAAHDNANPTHFEMAHDAIESSGHPDFAKLQQELQHAKKRALTPSTNKAHSLISQSMVRGILHDVMHHAETISERPGAATRARPALDLHALAMKHLHEGNPAESARAIRALAGYLQHAGINVNSYSNDLEPGQQSQLLNRFAEDVETGRVTDKHFLTPAAGPEWNPPMDRFRAVKQFLRHGPHNMDHARELLAQLGDVYRAARQPSQPSPGVSDGVESEEVKAPRDVSPSGAVGSTQVRSQPVDQSTPPVVSTPERFSNSSVSGIPLQGPLVGVQHHGGFEAEPNSVGIYNSPIPRPHTLNELRHLAASVGAHAALSGKTQGITSHMPRSPEHSSGLEEVAHLYANSQGHVGANLGHAPSGISRTPSQIADFAGPRNGDGYPYSSIALHSTHPQVGDSDRSAARAFLERVLLGVKNGNRLHAQVHINADTHFRQMLKSAVLGGPAEAGIFADWLDERGHHDAAAKIRNPDGSILHHGPAVAGAIAEEMPKEKGATPAQPPAQPPAHLQAGRRVGRAMARDRWADELTHEWTGLDGQDADQLTAAGLEPGTPEWDAAEAEAERAFREYLEERQR